MDDVQDKHPSFGLLQIGRISGGTGRTALFGSSIDHGHTIRLRVSRAVRNRSLNRYWYGETEQLVEIEMSPVQWAEAISSLNCGVGEPCTLINVAGKRQPEYEGTPNIREQFNDEFKESMERLAARFKQDRSDVGELLKKKSLTKEDREKIMWAFSRLEQEIERNLPFVHSQFDEAVDKTICEAKGEIDAFLTHAVINAGRLAMAAKMEAGQLEQPGVEIKCLDQ